MAAERTRRQAVTCLITDEPRWRLVMWENSSGLASALHNIYHNYRNCFEFFI
jgi:hypothetical protein